MSNNLHRIRGKEVAVLSHCSKHLQQREQHDSVKDLRAEIANLNQALTAALAREKQKDEQISYLMKSKRAILARIQIVT